MNYGPYSSPLMFGNSAIQGAGTMGWIGAPSKGDSKNPTGADGPHQPPNALPVVPTLVKASYAKPSSPCTKPR